MPTKIKLYLPDVIGSGYGKFWASKKRYRVLKGGKGSKKSATTSLNIIKRMMKYHGSNTLVVRQVMDTHRTSTFAQLKWAQNRLGVSHLWKCTTSPMEMTFIPTGQKILFRGFDDVFKLASTTVESGYLCWVWLEEAFEINLEDDFDKLDLSVPRGAVPTPLFKQTTITFNPWSEHHWLKSRFFDRENVDVDKFTTTYQCNEFLDDTDRAIFERMRVENPRKYAVAGLGDWGIADGLVFENWSVEQFDKNNIGICFDSSGQIVDESWKYKHVFGLDYGYTNDPTAFIAYAANPIDKLIYIYDEHYATRMLNSDIANMIKRKGYAKERIRADSAEPKSNDDLRYSHGITRIEPSVKGPDSIKNGISALQEYRFIVHPNCTNTISELSSYIWKTAKNSDGKNEPIDSDNHLMDAMRYAFEDIKNFRAVSEEDKIRRDRAARRGSIVGADDFKGGWG